MGAADATSWLSQHLGLGSAARQITRTAEVLGVFPELSVRLRDAESTVGVASVAALARLSARVTASAIDADDQRVQHIVESVGVLDPRAVANKVTVLLHESWNRCPNGGWPRGAG